jgi:hypothetical protein
MLFRQPASAELQLLNLSGVASTAGRQAREVAHFFDHHRAVMSDKAYSSWGEPCCGRLRRNCPVAQTGGVRFRQNLRVHPVPRPVGAKRRRFQTVAADRTQQASHRQKCRSGAGKGCLQRLGGAHGRSSPFARLSSAATARSATTDHHSKQKFSAPFKHFSQPASLGFRRHALTPKANRLFPLLDTPHPCVFKGGAVRGVDDA